MRVRHPYVAGYFYPSKPDELKRLIESLFKSGRGPGGFRLERFSGRKVIGAILPHAGYIYSGEIAAHGYAAYMSSGLKRRVIVIGPNHTGLGSAISIYPYGAWDTPLGRVELDKEIIDDLSGGGGYIAVDDMGHMYEHSVEVHIPLLQYIYSLAGETFKLTPIVMLLQGMNGVKELGDALVKVVRDYGEDELFIVASTDFTHYEDADSAAKKDRYAFEAIKAIDSQGLIDNVYKYNVSMCGYGPTATLLYVLERIGGYRVELLKYGHSGEVTGDYSNVVTYASFIAVG